MKDQQALTPVEEDAKIDSAILSLLLDADVQRPWSVDEVAREIGHDVDTADSLSRLHGAGLVHRLDGFVFATRAALKAEETML